ncbi:unannotated protein [freshwater metagenome]
MPAKVMIALIKDAFVITSLGLRSALTMSTMSRPVSCEAANNLESGAGMPVIPGAVIPRASAIKLIVDAVPIVLQ